MNVLGIDWGEKRIGLAFGDALGVATPLPAAIQAKKRERLAQIEKVVNERRVEAIVVGYPLNMNGSVGFKAKEVDAFISEIEPRFGLPIYRVDERLSSQVAEGQMRELKLKAERKSGELDSRAAALILQDFLEQQLGPPLLPDPEDDLDLR